MADSVTQVLSSGSHTNPSHRLSRNPSTESEPLLPSASHETHYVPLLTSVSVEHHPGHQSPQSRTNHNLLIDDQPIHAMTGSSLINSTTTATLRPTVTTTTADSLQSSTSSNTSVKEHRSGLIQIPIPDSFMRKSDKLGPNKEPNSIWRSFLAFLFVFANMTLNLTVLAIIHERVPRSQPPLPDLAFDILPEADWALSVAEYIIVFQVVGVLLLIFFHRYRSVLVLVITPIDKWSQIVINGESHDFYFSWSIVEKRFLSFVCKACNICCDWRSESITSQFIRFIICVSIAGLNRFWPSIVYNQWIRLNIDRSYD